MTAVRQYRARRIMEQHRAIGYTFRAAAGKLKIGPARSITPTLEKAVIEYRAEMLAALAWDEANPRLAAAAPEAPSIPYSVWRREKTRDDFLSGRIFDPDPPAAAVPEIAPWPERCHWCHAKRFVRKGKTEFVCLNCYPEARGETQQGKEANVTHTSINQPETVPAPPAV